MAVKIKLVGTGGLLIFLTLVITMAIGWSANIVKLARSDFHDGVSGMEVVRVIGIPVVPVGVVVGYME